jgi:glyoxylase-like metal-dependent hydrolase (beta-lactamase superfamily II)
MFGYQIEQPPLKTLDIKEGEDITFGNSVLKVISTPGHTSGSVCIYAPEDKFVLTGDTLFAGSCGRTDLPESEEDAMPDSLNKIAREMPADYIVYPGHGPNSTMKDELMQNPFLRDKGF